MGKCCEFSSTENIEFEKKEKTHRKKTQSQSEPKKQTRKTNSRKKTITKQKENNTPTT